jgi:hypothetical protein
VFYTSTYCSSRILSRIEPNGLDIAHGQVTTACKGVSVDPKSIVGLFLIGDGIQALCNVDVVTKTVGNGQTTTAAMPASTNTNKPAVVFPTGGLVTISMSSQSSSISSSPTASMSLSSISKAASSSSSDSSTLKKTTSSSYRTKPTASGSAAALKQNPSVPNCVNCGSSGSPFDSYSDQACAKSAGSVTKMSRLRQSLGRFISYRLYRGEEDAAGVSIWGVQRS